MVQIDQGVQISHHESMLTSSETPLEKPSRSWHVSLNLDAQKCPCFRLLYMQGLSLKGIIFFEKNFKFSGVSWHWFCVATKKGNTFIRKCIAYWKQQFHWNRTSDQWIYGYLPVCGPLQAIPNRSMSLQQPRPHDKATPISSQEKWVSQHCHVFSRKINVKQVGQTMLEVNNC